MIARRSFEMTAIRRRTMTERPPGRDGFIWEVRRTLDESYTWCRGGRPRKDVKKECLPLLSTTGRFAPAWGISRSHEREEQLRGKTRKTMIGKNPVARISLKLTFARYYQPCVGANRQGAKRKSSLPLGRTTLDDYPLKFACILHLLANFLELNFQSVIRGSIK